VDGQRRRGKTASTSTSARRKLGMRRDRRGTWINPRPCRRTRIGLGTGPVTISRQLPGARLPAGAKIAADVGCLSGDSNRHLVTCEMSGGLRRAEAAEIIRAGKVPCRAAPALRLGYGCRSFTGP